MPVFHAAATGIAVSLLLAACGEAAPTPVPAFMKSAAPIEGATSLAVGPRFSGLWEAGGKPLPSPSEHPTTPEFPVPDGSRRTSAGSAGAEPSPVLFLAWEAPLAPADAAAFYADLTGRWTVAKRSDSPGGAITLDIEDATGAFSGRQVIRPADGGSTLSLSLVPAGKGADETAVPTLAPIAPAGGGAPASLPAGLVLPNGVVVVAAEDAASAIAVFRSPDRNWTGIAGRYATALAGLGCPVTRSDEEGGVLLDGLPNCRVVVRAVEEGTEVSVEWAR